MDCNIFPDKILQYLDKELSLEDRINFEEHRESCAKCQLLYNEVSSTYTLITREQQFSVSPYFYHQIKSKLETKNEPRTINLVPTILKPIAIAASIALGIIIGRGEESLLLSTDNELELVTESLSPILPTEYSVWTTLNDDYGSED